VLDIKSTEDVIDQGLFVLVHGQTGAGKTSLVKTIPEAEKNTLVVSAEGGTLPLRNMNISMFEIDAYKDMELVLEFLSEDTEYKWVVIDSLTEIADKCLASESRKGGTNNKPGWDEYYWFNAKMEELVRRLRDMRGLHVVLTCLSAYDVEDSRGKLTPVIPARKLRAKLAQYFDLVLYLNVTEDGTREFITDCSPRVVAKDRSGVLESPEKADLGVIVDKIYGNREPERKVTPDREKFELLAKIADGEATTAKDSGTGVEELREALWKHEIPIEEATKNDLKEYLEELREEYKKITEFPQEESGSGDSGKDG
jgi:phage nucleotide-binding protein